MPLPGSTIASIPVPLSSRTPVPPLPYLAPALSAPIPSHCTHETAPEENTDESRNGRVRMQAFFSGQGRKIVPALPDGNCLFRSLATLLTCDQEDHLMVRNMLMEFELANADLFRPFVTTQSLQDHIKAIKPNYAWGSNTEVLAAATLCQIPIYVACDTPPSGCWKVYKPLNKQSSTISPFVIGRGWLELCYTNNSHFDAVQPMDNKKILLQPVITPSHSYEDNVL